MFIHIGIYILFTYIYIYLYIHVYTHIYTYVCANTYTDVYVREVCSSTSRLANTQSKTNQTCLPVLEN